MAVLFPFDREPFQEMSQPSKPAMVAVWGTLSVVMIWVVLSFLKERSGGAEMTEDKAPSLPVLKQLDPFSLTNQHGRVVTLESYRGKIWVADVIFARCPGPCSEMTRKMKRIQEKLGETEDVRLVSLTTDPEYDTPEVLRKYGMTFGSDQEHWDFLTGTKPQMKEMLTKNLLQVALEKEESQMESENDFFIHSTLMVVVDGKGRIRATVETLTPGALEQILETIEVLKSE